MLGRIRDGALATVVAATACSGTDTTGRTTHMDGDDRDASMSAGGRSPGRDGGVGGSGATGDHDDVDAAPIYYGFDAGSEGTEGNSCEGLPQTCGVDGSDDCCRSLLVPGGTFNRSVDGDPATVSTFRLDKYEVTAARFERFREAWRARWRPLPGGGKHVHLNGGNGLANSADAAGGFEPGWQPVWAEHVSGEEAEGTGNHAVGGLNWYEAYAFCIWDGGFLPSEAEWGYAAAGGAEQRTWPWGDEGYCAGGCDDTRIAVCYPDGNLRPTGVCYGSDLVGIRPLGDGRWGHSDLVGNESEWALDGLPPGVGEAFYESTDRPPYTPGCEDCAYTGLGATFRVNRGGSYIYVSPGAATRRHFSPPEWHLQGVRCARPPEKALGGGG